MYNIPRGTRDFTPREMEKRSYVENTMRTVFKTYGYREIQTPVFETLELFTAKSGENIIDELYAFTDKGGRKLALRPELTAPVIRFYTEKLQMEPKPLKLFYFGNCYRYDRPQKGRYREFMQAGCELIGVNTPEAYAELIALAYKLLVKTGLKNITLHIGNLQILSTLFTKLGLSTTDIQHITPLIDKSLYDDIIAFLTDSNIPPAQAEEFITLLQTTDTQKIKEHIKNNKKAEQELSKLQQIIDLLTSSFNIPNIQLKLGIVRGLDYYQGIVFEIEAPKLGAEKQLCGGGAYELISLFKGRPTPTAGFALGFDRTILALETEHYSFPNVSLPVFIIPVDKTMIPESLKIAQSLRDQNIFTDIDLMQRGVGKSLKYANTLNAQYTILIGPEELAQKSATLRNMHTGEQQVIPITKLLAEPNTYIT